MAGQEVCGMLIRLEATTAQLRQEMDRADASVTKATGRIDSQLSKVDSAFDRVAKGAQSAAGILKGALALAVGGAGVSAIIDQAEAYTTVANRLKLVTSSSKEFIEAQNAVFSIAQKSGQPLGATAELYQRIATNQKDLKLSGQGVAGIVETISKTLVISGTSAASADAALVQLGQSFASGTLRGEELNSVLEQAPALAQAIAKGMGKTVGELRSLGADGKLTAAAVVAALQAEASAVDSLFNQMQSTIGTALTRIQTSVTRIIGQVDTLSGSSVSLAGAINQASQALDKISVPEALAVISEHADTLATVLNTVLYAALGRVVAGLAASGGATYASIKATAELALSSQAAAAAAVRRAEVDLVSAKNAVELARLNVALASTSAEATAAERALTAAKAEALAMSARLSGAKAKETIANEAAASSATAYGLAMKVATAAATGVARAGAGLLSLLGGPVGLALTAGAVALSFVDFSDKSKALMGDLGDLSKSVEQLRGEFNKLSEDQKTGEINTWKDKQLGATLAVENAYKALKDSVEAAVVEPPNPDMVDPAKIAAQVRSFEELAEKLDAARSSGQALGPILREAAAKGQISPEQLRQWEDLAVAFSKNSVTAAETKIRLDALTGALNQNTTATQANNQAKAGFSTEGEKYLDTIQKQLAGLQDGGDAIKEANRYIAEHTSLSEADRVAILSTANAIEANKAATKAAKDETKLGNAAAREAATELKNQQKALEELSAKSAISTKAANDLADAYLAGIDNIREITLQQKVEEELLKTGAGARDKVTEAIKSQMAAEDRRDVSKNIADLRLEAKQTLAQATATLQGADALEEFNLQKAMQLALVGKSITYGSQEYDQLLKTTKAQLDNNKALEQAGEANSIIDRLYPQTKLLRDYTRELESLNKAMDLDKDHADAYRDAIARLGVEYEQNQRAATAWGQFTEGAVDRIDDAFADMWKSVLSKSGNFMDTLKDSFRQFLAEMLHMAITKPIIVQIGASLGVGTAAAQSSGLFGGAAGSSGIDLASLWNAGSTAFSVGSSAFGSAVAAGWSAGQGFLGGIQGAISGGTGYLSNAIGGLFSSGVQGGAGVMLDSAGNLVSTAAGGATALGGTLAGVGGALYGYGQSGLKGAATGAAGSVGGYYAGSALGSLVGPLGTVVGGVLGSALGGFLGGSIFGGSWQTKDQGISLGVAGGDLSSMQFEYQKKKGGLFGSNKKRTRYSALDSDTQTALDDSYAATTGAVFDLFDKLNVTLNDGVLDGLNVAATQISTKGKTAEQIQEEITKWFAGVADSVTSAINTATGTGLDGYNFEALTAFVNNLYSVNDIFTTLKFSLYDTSVSGGKLAESLSAAAGGLANLQAIASTYYDNFYTDTEKADNVLEAVRKQFGGLDVSFPDTRQAFRDVVDGLDRTTEAGQQMFVTLTSLSGSAASAYTILEQRAAEAKATQQAALDAAQAANANYYDLFTTDAEKAADKLIGVRAEFKALGVELPATRQAFMEMIYAAQQGAVAGKATASALIGLATDADAAYKILQSALMQGATDAFSALQRSISAQQKVATAAYNARVTSLNDMLSTVNTSVSDLTSLSSSLGSALKSLSGTSDDAVRMLRAQAQATLQSALATARAGGSLASFSGLADALDTVGSNNTDLYTSLEEFNRDQGRTANVVAELNLLNGKQLTTAEKSVKALQDQLDQAKKAYDAQSAQFDAELAFGQAQLDMLNGLDTSVMTVTAAVNAMNAAVVAALKGGVGSGASMSPSSAVTAIQTAYRDILGREADAPGLAAWTGALANGASLEQVLASIKASAAANGQLAGHATGGYISGPGTGTSDSILTRLSNGEYVLKAAAVRAFGTDALDQMNSLQIPAFATGGPVLDISSPSQVFANRVATPASSSSSDAATVEELRGLRSEMQANFEFISKYIKETADNTDEIVNRGLEIVGVVETKVATS